MPTVTVSGGGVSSTPSYDSNEAFPFAMTLAEALNAGLENGSLTAFVYSTGSVAPGGPEGVTFINTETTQVVTIPTTDVGTVVSGGPTFITGGAQGETVIAGSSGLTYTDITPSGSAVDYIVAGDGSNLITTSNTGTGNYQIDSGAGNDSISVFGNGLIDAGTGFNSISVAGGSSFIYSEGHDNITLGGVGTDTIDIGTGQATINAGASNVEIFEDSDATNPFFLAPGTGSDTVLAAAGGTVYAGTGGNNFLVAGAGELHGAENGDKLYATGNAPVALYAGAGDETLSGAGGTFSGTVAPLAGTSFSASAAGDSFYAGSGSDTIIGGAGNDTVYFNGLRADYTITAEPDGTFLVTGVGGVSSADTLSGIETLAFLDETQAAPCYCCGTAIATEAGETLVEALRIGDLVRTASGALRPVRWIGRRCYDGRFIHGNRNVLPVTIRAGALADGLPVRDLSVSPKHAMFLDGALIPAEHLVNGRSIVQQDSGNDADYFHIELDSHDVLLAEGSPSESFVDRGTRQMFQNAHRFATDCPDGVADAWTYCVDRVEAGPILEAVRRRVGARAGLAWCHVDDAFEPGDAEGSIDVANGIRVEGWAFDANRPHTALQVDIFVDGVFRASVMANNPRADLTAAGKGSGRCAFAHRFDPPLALDAPHLVVVRTTPSSTLQAAIPVAREAGSSTQGPLEGRIDLCTADRIEGWAFDAAWADTPVDLEILLGDMVLGYVAADRFRPDLAVACLGSGHCAFVFDLVKFDAVGREVIVRRIQDGALVGRAIIPPPACTTAEERFWTSLPVHRPASRHALPSAVRHPATAVAAPSPQSVSSTRRRISQTARKVRVV